MKKIFLSLACILGALSAWADEGMWLLPMLQKFNEEAMRTGIAAEVQFVLEGLDTLNRIERV